MIELQGYLNQDHTVMQLIRQSNQHCELSGMVDRDSKLPQISKAKRDECKKHVSGQTMLIRESSPEYYRRLTESLEAHQALLLYVAENMDVYGKYGNRALNEELKAANLRFGTNLGEDVAGTNAAVIASRCRTGVWTVGEQNFSKVLQPYAFYAFRINGRYNRLVYGVLVTRKENLSAETVSLFQLIEATESVFGSGLVTEDVLIKDAMIRETYSDSRTENILIIVGSSCQVTYANNSFYRMFDTSWDKVINFPLEEVIPELRYLSEDFRKGIIVQKRAPVKFGGRINQTFLVDCTYTNRDVPSNGVVITMQRRLDDNTPKSSSTTSAKYTFDDLIGISGRFLELKQFAERIAATDCTVMIRGESGTGKELFAQSIHAASERRSKPFVSINCAAIPRDLIESELFGYVGGAFTGASKNGAKGKFELANEGTLFLDEIGEMPIDMQSVLLRVIEDGAVTRIGGDKQIPVNVRLIVATNQNLESHIREGKFRLDLFYRLNVISLNMIPLRERREDINVLADYFIVAFSRKHHKSCSGITPEARTAMQEYDWPGNVRELRNVIERGLITTESNFIELRHLPPEISGNALQRSMAAEVPRQEVNGHFSDYVVEFRRETAERLMKKYGGNKSRVAKEMGIARTTLYRILSKSEPAIKTTR